MSRPRLIVVGPLPPPTHGVAISTSLVLANPLLRERFVLVHLDTSDRRTHENIGRWELTNIRLGLTNLVQLAGLLRGEPGIVYLPISQNVAAFLRDSLFVHVGKLRGWKVAAHLRGSELHDLYARTSRPLRFWMRFTLKRLDSLAVMGYSVRGTVEGLVAPDRIAVVPNGTPDPGSYSELRDPSRVLFLSNLRRRKGVCEAVEAALIVLDRHASAQFVFAGTWEDASLERELRERVEPAGERIRFLPPVGQEEKRRLLLSSSILLFPPVEPEGHPRVVLEALAAGLPVVTTDRGTIAETVVDGECGLVLPTSNPQELAESVLRILEDEGLSDRLAKGARRRYLECYTQEKADETLAAWLARVTGEAAA